MTKSMIFDLVDRELLNEWIDEAKQIDESYFSADEKRLKDELDFELGEKGRELTEILLCTAEKRLESVYLYVLNKALHYGIRIGMELQKIFGEFDKQ